MLAESVTAACRLHDRLDSWASSDRVLGRIKAQFPGFGLDECHVKVVTLNSLYSTNVFATWRMAEHIHGLLDGSDLGAAGPELVEEIAALPKGPSQKNPRRHTSFASKFAHFFIDPERFPIYDQYADVMIALHLGRYRRTDPEHPYKAHHANFFALKEAAGLSHVPNCHIDRYFWIAGQYRAWQKISKGQINTTLRELFEDPSPDVQSRLAIIAPDLSPAEQPAPRSESR